MSMQVGTVPVALANAREISAIKAGGGAAPEVKASTAPLVEENNSRSWVMSGAVPGGKARQKASKTCVDVCEHEVAAYHVQVSINQSNDDAN